MRLIKSAAIAAIMCLFVAARADAGPTGTWIGVAASVSPAGATQIFSLRSTAVPGDAVNLTVRYACAGAPSCTFSAAAAHGTANVYVIFGGLPETAPRHLFVLITSSACNTQYGATALMSVFTNGNGDEIDECLIPQGARLPGGGTPWGPVQQPHIRIPQIPPFVHRPAPIPEPNPGPLSTHP